MPASSGVGMVSGHIESSLRASLGGSQSITSTLDQKLVSSSKTVLLHKIDFEQAVSDSSFQLNYLRQKYTPLNPSKPGFPPGNSASSQMVPTSTIYKANSEINMTNGHVAKAKVALSAVPNDGIPKPAVVLFSPEKVQLEWKNSLDACVGLCNTNNNCYLNSVLQVLRYTPPLVNYVFSNDHTYNCKQAGFCMMCELQRHIKRCQEQQHELLKHQELLKKQQKQQHVKQRNFSISPQAILGKINMIAKHLSYGRQEDAHEFLRYVVEAMQKSCLHGYPETLDRFSKDTTVVNQIFGGYLRSQVMCLKCKERSNTYDPLLDISLDIKNVNTLQRAFERFVQPETLDNDNAYNCPRCKTKVPAQKRFTVHRAPNILTVQLKRFDYNRMMGGKVTRQIIYPERLDLRSYMSITQGPPVMYQLYAVLTHVGHSAGSGHYYCNIRAPNKEWFSMNDQNVSSIGLQRVLNTEAYLLFYCRNKSRFNQYEIPKSMRPKLLPGHKLQTQEKRTPMHSEPSNDTGCPISRNENGKPVEILRTSNNMPMRRAGDGASASVSAPKSTTIPVAAQREKVSFGLTKPTPSENVIEKTREWNTPRIVMHIKNGKPIETLRTPNNMPARQGCDGASASATTSNPTTNPVAAHHENASFGLLKPKPNENMRNRSKEGNPPRIVMHIKNGKVFFPGDVKEEDQRWVNGVDGKAKLVPYNDDSSEEEVGLVIRPPVPHQTNKDKTKANVKCNGVVFDERLNATTVVPGSYKPLDTGSHQEGAGKAGGDCSSAKPAYSAGRFTSPLGRSVNDSLTVVTNTGPQHRVNATTPWHVLDPESAISPSLASGSSNTSMNSTTDWQVTPGGDGKRSKSMLPDVVSQCNGWTVTPVKDTNGQTSNAKCLHSDKHFAPTENGSSKLHNELNITIKKQPYNGGWESKPKNSDLFMTELLGTEVKQEPGAASNGTNGEVRTSPKHSNSANQLPNGHAEINGSPNSPHKKHKKGKKRQRDRSDEESDQVNGCGASDLLNMMKKKKKKKKHKHGDRERLLSTSDSDSSRKGSKRSSSSDETDDSKHKQRHESCVDAYDPYTWNTWTKAPETIDKAVSVKEVPAQSWDHHIKDGYKRRNHEELSTPKRSWDGMRSNSDTVLSEMKKMSNCGYGNQVSSWEGGKSIVDKEVERDRQHNRKRQWSEDYEEDLERGKVKKVKSYNDRNFVKNNAYSHGNPFQKMADMRWEGNEWDRRNKYGTDRPDRSYYSGSSHYSSYGGYGGGGYSGRESGFRDNYHNHNYNHVNVHYDSYNHNGGYHGNKRRDRYH